MKGCVCVRVRNAVRVLKSFFVRSSRCKGASSSLFSEAERHHQQKQKQKSNKPPAPLSKSLMLSDMRALRARANQASQMKASGLNGTEMNCCFKSDAQTPSHSKRTRVSRGMRLEKPLLREWLREKSAVRSPLCLFALSPRALRANANNAARRFCSAGARN